MNSLRSLFVTVAIIIFSLPVFTLAQPSTVDSKQALEGFDAQAEQIMRELQVVGAAVGIIQDGKVIFTKGYGSREIGTAAPVTPDTVFAVGSVTKSFTTSVMATLVDEGKLNWDTPVRDYLPWFQMYDPVATKLLTPRDLVTHRTGMPRHDFIRFSTPETREELVRRIRFMEPSRSFREVFQYSNLMYVVAGYLAGQVGGATWEDLVKQKIFMPLGMDSSNTSVQDMQKQDNFARPYILKNGMVEASDFYNYQKFGIGPNGAVNSTVNDMLKYMQMHLDQGAFAGKQVISAAEIKELHKPVMVETPTANYALGWFVRFHSGHLVIEHGGGIIGFSSQMILVPDEKLGIIVLNNQESDLPFILGWSLVDRLLGLESQDYLAKTAAVEKQHQKSEEDKQKQLEAGHIPNANPTLDLAAYKGDYFHPAYGAIHVIRTAEGLAVKFEAVELSLKHYNYDWFKIESANEHIGSANGQLAQFRVDEHGKVTQLLLPLEAAVKPFVFVKK